ncbi:hypothetical protein NLU14_08495 [Marinobacter sp. 71-i]|uniref:Uncharacterized protein n=1 Tax=Marinobacter iranensis TaxID=2962607 RepID=A0ABT5Y9L0_9GAMM|nr:hypothetical protein [Marinobacter iranensis]MDF0750267.1 hypothetical protein [Marinobacter iranensis]
MIVTTDMLRELEKAVAPDAQAEIRIYAAGCDIRVRWNGGLREANQNLGAENMAQVADYREDQTRRAWDRLIVKFQGLRDMKPR